MDNSKQKTVYPLLFIFFLLSSSLSAQKYLDTDEVILIVGSTVGLFAIGELYPDIDSNFHSRISNPILLDRSAHKFLGGRYYPDKTNFFDKGFGSVFTPSAGLLLLLSADLSYPQGNKSKTVWQDQFLYSSGLLTSSTVTTLAKKFFKRPRPYLVLYPDESWQRTDIDPHYDYASFFSGHTSSSFFAMHFLNKRIHSIMRSEMSSGSYHDWRALPSLVCYSWASLVGWSRISAYKHYFSDVLAGAITGVLIAELFYSFIPEPSYQTNSDALNGMSSNYTPVIQFHIPL